jgi:hypothetical protein
LQPRDILKRNIEPGRTASDTLDILNDKLTEAGFGVMVEFNGPQAILKLSTSSLPRIPSAISVTASNRPSRFSIPNG